MDHRFQPYLLPGHDRVGHLIERGLQFGKRAAIAFGLAVVSAIVIGAAVTDNGLVQLFVTLIAAVALWVPFLLVLLLGERTFRGRSKVVSKLPDRVEAETGNQWRRLAFAAPSQRDRISGLEQSIARSRSRLGRAKLDPEAVDLVVLIDRRLPDLIDRELDALPPDDKGRREKLDGLISLVDQFARHCSRHGADDSLAFEREAEVLRRRFEDRLAPPPFESQ